MQSIPGASPSSRSVQRTTATAPPRTTATAPAARARDAGLRRITRLTGWTAAGAIVLTGFVAEVAAHVKPGRSLKAKSIASAAASSAVTPVPSPQVVTPPAGGGGQDSSSSDPAAGSADSGTASSDPGAASGGQGSAASSLQPPVQVPVPVPADTSGAAVSGGS